MHTIERVLHRRGLVVVSPDVSVLEVARRMTDERVGAAVVVDGDALAGIFSERDLMARVVAPERDPASTPVAEVMTRPVVTAELGETVSACEQKMRRAGCRHLPVVADGRVIAMLSIRDLLSDEIEEQVAENRELRAYLHQTPLGAV
jgi:CBS domain-containing protein